MVARYSARSMRTFSLRTLKCKGVPPQTTSCCVLKGDKPFLVSVMRCLDTLLTKNAERFMILSDSDHSIWTALLGKTHKCHNSQSSLWYSLWSVLLLVAFIDRPLLRTCVEQENQGCYGEKALAALQLLSSLRSQRSGSNKTTYSYSKDSPESNGIHTC